MEKHLEAKLTNSNLKQNLIFKQGPMFGVKLNNNHYLYMCFAKGRPHNTFDPTIFVPVFWEE